MLSEYKEWRQKILSDTESMNSLKLTHIGGFLSIVSVISLIIFGEKIYSVGITGFWLGFIIGMFGIVKGNYLIIKRKEKNNIN